MRHTVIAVILPVILFFGAFNNTNAQSAGELEAQLQVLLQQLSALQQSLPSTPSTPLQSGSCPSLSRTLRIDMSGSDVVALQSFLISRGLLQADAATGYFGRLTQAGVQQLQVQHAIASSGSPDTTGYGAVGPRTRSLIRSLCGSGASIGVRGMCLIGGTTVASGAAITLYSTDSVPLGTNCNSYAQVRTCNDGKLSGTDTYRFPSCSINSCTQDGVVMASGETRTFYRQRNLPYGLSCQATARTCSNGVLTGNTDYPFATCSAATTPASCALDGITLEHDQSRSFYRQSSVLAGQTCSPFVGTRACDNGNLTGDVDYRFASCSVSAFRSCVIVADGATTTVAHGATRNFWSRSSLPYSATCEAYRLSRTCNDGTLSGSTSFSHPECEVIPAKNCTLDGITVTHGTSRNFYSQVSVPSGQNCGKLFAARKCTNGVLSGETAFKYAFCAPTGQRYCKLDAVYVAHEGDRVFYSQETAAFGSTCDQFDQKRTCNDGTFSGSATYQYSSCKNATGRSCSLDGKTVAHGSTATFYSTRSASDCAEYAQARQCIDGDLSGSNDFKYKSCTTSSQ